MIPPTFPSSFMASLLGVSFGATALAGGIFLFRFLFRYRLGSGWNYTLWMLLLLRLALPLSPVSGGARLADALSRLPLGSPRSASPVPAPFDQGHGGTAYLAGGGEYAISFIRTDLLPALFFLWLSGVVAATALLIVANGRVARRLRGSVPVEDGRVRAIFRGAAEDLGIRRRIRLLRTEALRSPVLYGAVSPAVILPTALLDECTDEQLRHVFYHELSHCKRRDIEVNFLSWVFAALHWFNPVIALSFRAMREDREAACDAEAVSALGAGERLRYGSTILFCAERGAAPVPSPLASAFHGRTGLERRLRLIASPRRRVPLIRFLGGLASVFLGVLALTGFSLVDEGEAPEGRVVEVPELDPYFAGYRACFVLYDEAADSFFVLNEKAARQRFPPDSTLKIAAALIALEEGVVPDLDESFSWNGRIYPYTEWNRDQTLGSALAYSVTWVFDEIAARMGSGRMRKALSRIRYGNAERIADAAFDAGLWSDSSLGISPFEQVEFLRALDAGELSFAEKNVELVESILDLTPPAAGGSGAVSLIGKTGSGVVKGRAVRGWFVGRITDAGGRRYFATHIRGDDGSDGATAKKLTLRVLSDRAAWLRRGVPTGGN